MRFNYQIIINQIKQYGCVTSQKRYMVYTKYDLVQRITQYYVYLFNSSDYQETEIELEKAKLLELFEDAYSLKID